MWCNPPVKMNCRKQMARRHLNSVKSEHLDAKQGASTYLSLKKMILSILVIFKNFSATNFVSIWAKIDKINW